MPRFELAAAGESHGRALVGIVKGLPAGLAISTEQIDAELARRQGGYGRGGRQRLEHDRVEILSGLRAGVTLGSPVTLMIPNRDSRIDDDARTPPITQPRPGHADLAGAVKWLTGDGRGAAEIASARHTALRVAAGALARQLLAVFGIDVFGFVRSIGPAGCEIAAPPGAIAALRQARDASETYCPDPAATAAQREAIRKAKEAHDTLGGIVEVLAAGLPMGLGAPAPCEDRLDARLAAAVMGVPAIKGVEIGLGFAAAGLPGSRVHDPIEYDASRQGELGLGFVRPTNNAGGLEGGITNGQRLVLRAAMKPIPTLGKPLPSVDMKTKEAARAAYERSDVCAVPAASVVVENVVAFELARALLDKFAGDSMIELKSAYETYLRHARMLPLAPPAMTLA